MMKRIRVEINYINEKNKNIYIPFIKQTINKLINYLIKNEYIDNKTIKKKEQLNILICDDREIKKLNEKYRHINKITNELSFSYINDNSNFIGEIVINWDEVIRDSDKTFTDRKKSILNFISHAILHIFGYTHDTKKNEEKMEKLKTKLIKYVENIYLRG